VRQAEKCALGSEGVFKLAAAVNTISNTWLSFSVTKAFFWVAKSHIQSTMVRNIGFGITALIQKSKPVKLGLHVGLWMLQSKRWGLLLILPEQHIQGAEINWHLFLWSRNRRTNGQCLCKSELSNSAKLSSRRSLAILVQGAH